MGLLGSIGAIAGAVGGISSTILGNNSAKHEAEKNRDWQENMSNTSVQRRMEDLKAAGLNPLLAVSSASAGASTPTGSQADIKRFDPSFITTAINAYLADKQGQVDDAQKRKIDAEAQNIENNNSLFELKRDREIMFNQMQSLKIDTEKLQQEVLRTNNLKTQSDIILNTFRAKGIKIDNEQAEIVLQLMKNDMEAWENTTTAKNFDYVTGQVGRFTDWLRSLVDVIPGVDITETSSQRRGSGYYTTTTHSRRYF